MHAAGVSVLHDETFVLEAREPTPRTPPGAGSYPGTPPEEPAPKRPKLEDMTLEDILPKFEEWLVKEKGIPRTEEEAAVKEFKRIYTLVEKIAHDTQEDDLVNITMEIMGIVKTDEEENSD